MPSDSFLAVWSLAHVTTPTASLLLLHCSCAQALPVQGLAKVSYLATCDHCTATSIASEPASECRKRDESVSGMTKEVQQSHQMGMCCCVGQNGVGGSIFRF
jgi:hypothetical protein